MEKIATLNAALKELRQASFFPSQWAHKIQLDQNYNFKATHNFKAAQLLWEAAKMGGVDPPPSHFQSRELQEAYIQMKAAYWDPTKWCLAIRNGHKGAPYKYTLTRNWLAQQALWAARNAGPNPIPDPPPPPPVHDFHPDPLLLNAAVGAFSCWDAMAWPGCVIYVSADPGPATADDVDRARADHARSEGHPVEVWYVPDQVSHERAVEVCGILGCDPANIVADCETLGRWQIAYHEHGVTKGIYNLSAIAGDVVAEEAIRGRKFKGMNEFYWNQSRRRRPDNHNLPVDSMQIASYNGCSDSTEPDCFDPAVTDYRDAGFFWDTVGAYQQGMTPEDWNHMPPVHR